MVLIRRPFSPNPFLPLHNFQRRFDFLGTQMHCFTENHIRFGRSFTSQGANSLLLMDSEHRLSPARTDTPFDAPVPNGQPCRNMSQIGAVDKVTFILVLTNKKDAHRRHPACFIIRFRFNAVADKRQWSSAASKPRRKTRAKLCSRFCAENEPSHQTCRSFSASR